MSLLPPLCLPSLPLPHQLTLTRSRTHARMHARAHIHTHSHTHTHSLSLSLSLSLSPPPPPSTPPPPLSNPRTQRQNWEKVCVNRFQYMWRTICWTVADLPECAGMPVLERNVNDTYKGCVCVCVCVRARACVRACVRRLIRLVTLFDVFVVATFVRVGRNIWCRAL